MPHSDDTQISRDPNNVQKLEHHMVALAAERETTMTEIRKRYVLNSTASVEGFLFEHRVLPELLLEAEGPLRGAFGSDTIFSLRAPIDESGDQTLYAVAIWPGVASDARDALQRFDDTWWLAQARRASGYLTFSYELV